MAASWRSAVPAVSASSSRRPAALDAVPLAAVDRGADAPIVFAHWEVCPPAIRKRSDGLPDQRPPPATHIPFRPAAMAGDAVPMAPLRSSQALGGAAFQWACTRRGRMLMATVAFFAILLALAGMHTREVSRPSPLREPGLLTHHTQALSSQYRALTWAPYIPHIPHIPSIIIFSPFSTPSTTTLQLENGELATVPAQLKKTTPNFHLLMPAEKDTVAFCKTTLSAMLLNYPPPTIVHLFKKLGNDVQREKETLLSIRHYLDNVKYVHDHDLVLIVDGEHSWFQLPSDVIIKQYARLLQDANARLLKQYGVDKNGYQKFNQSIVFAAAKTCDGDDVACKYAPQSFLPANLYGKGEGAAVEDRPARYLNAKMLIGPAKDLKLLYQVAVGKMDLQQTHKHTVQSVFATMFGEQQLHRDSKEHAKAAREPPIAQVKSVTDAKPSPNTKLKLDTVDPTILRRYEFSIGLDYSHTLFQTLSYSSEDELVPLAHRNSSDSSAHQHATAWTQNLMLPPSLALSNPPFWRPSLDPKDNPSPSKKTPYIEALDYKPTLDNLPDRKTPWEHVHLVQNTYTGSVPAVLLAPLSASPSTANITYKHLWFSPYRRALLRNYFRTPQSPMGYHNSLVGGDRNWDMRGGRGGVWTTADTWLGWGELDGVCGSAKHMDQVFSDGMGPWLYEDRPNPKAEQQQ
ncbi:hypothetical protein ACEQ8H_003544 [Pleosporales sp. CAS-2024a]